MEGDRNVIHAVCGADACTTMPSYGPLGSKMRCFTHRIRGDISLGNKTCREKSCKEFPLFGERTVIWCGDHKGDADIDMREVCDACGLCGYLDEAKRCKDCNPRLFEKVRLERQMLVKKWLDENNRTPYTPDGPTGVRPRSRVHQAEA